MRIQRILYSFLYLLKLKYHTFIHRIVTGPPRGLSQQFLFISSSWWCICVQVTEKLSISEWLWLLECKDCGKGN